MSWKIIKKACVAMAAGVVALPLAAALSTAPAQAASVRSDTQARLPYNQYFADINGDGKADLLQVGANKIFAFEPDYPGTPILHKYLAQNIKRLLVGHFATSGWQHSRDDVCAITVDNGLSCYAISADGTTLDWWFSQPSFIADNEQAIVGDFDGSGNEDILIYNPSTGGVRLYERQVKGAFGFQPMPQVDLSNLAGRIGWRFYVGEFGQAANRADLLLVNPANGQVQRYDSASDSHTGQRQFWWAFSTATGVVGSNQDLSIARIGNGPQDDVVLRDRNTGAVQLKQAQWASGNVLAPLIGVNAAGLVHPGSGTLAFAKMALYPIEPGGMVRDDVLFFDYTKQVLYRYDARWDGSAYTYWWAYNKNRPRLDVGWPGVKDHPWTVLMCTIKGQTTTLARTAAWWHSMFSPATAGSIGAFYWDMSYGTLDLSSTAVHGTYAVPYTLAQLQARGGDTRGVALEECKAAAGRAAVRVSGKVVAYVNAPLFGGFLNGVTVTDNIEPSYFPLVTSSLGHEMGHGYGLNDNLTDSTLPQSQWYGDSYDLMSCDACAATSTGIGGYGGPGFNSANRYAINLLPPALQHERQLLHRRAAPAHQLGRLHDHPGVHP
jgi:hypothetical protein